MEELTPEQKQHHESNKVMRHSLAWLHFKMGTQQFFLEEVEDAMKARGLLELICKDLQKIIEEIEPPPAPEDDEMPKAPYVIDAGTVKAE